jgi:hypothetical protein
MGSRDNERRQSIVGTISRSHRRKQQRASKPSCRRGLQIEKFEDRILLSISPDLIAVVANDTTYQPVPVATPVLSTSPKEMTLVFSEGQSIDATTLSGIQVTRAGANGHFYDSVTNSTDMDDVVLVPGWVGIGAKSNEVTLRFSETLPDDAYRITIVGSNLYRGSDGKLLSPLKNSTNNVFQHGTANVLDWTFELDSAPQVVSVVPQPVTRDPFNGTLSQSRNTIEVYFSEGIQLDNVDPTLGVDPKYFQLIATYDTATSNDDVWVNPSSVDYDAAANKATLHFDQISYHYSDGSSDSAVSIGDLAEFATGSLRLRVGEAYKTIATNIVSVTDTSSYDGVGSTFTTATPLVSLSASAESVVVGAAISPIYYSMEFPGDTDGPGHRLLPSGVDEDGESHTSGSDTYAGVDTISYSFPATYEGLGGAVLTNLISESQEEAVREMLALFENYFGVQFREVKQVGASDPAGDMSIILGDPRALGAPATVGGVATVGPGTVLVNSLACIGDTGVVGGPFWNVMMHELLHNMSLLHAYDLPAGTIMGGSETTSQPDAMGAEAVYPGDADIIHGQLLHRPDSIDIDLYQFTLADSGMVSVETFAERLVETDGQLSLLDTSLVLYDVNGNVVARNDDYFSKDSFLSVSLAAGTYFVGVSAKGNELYDPNVVNSGIGGTTQGVYKLRLDYAPNAVDALRDVTGNAMDGDFDGKAGGVYDFWFTSQTTDTSSALNKTLFVDKVAQIAAGTTADGTLANPYSTISAAIAAAQGGDYVIRVVGNNTDNDFGGKAFQTRDAAGLDITGARLVDGQKFTISDGVLTVTFEFDKVSSTGTSNGVASANVRVPFRATDSAATVASSIVAAINSITRSPAKPLYVSAEISAQDPRVIVLKGPTAVFGAGNNPASVVSLTSTLQDNIAYQLGYDQYRSPLEDGSTLEVPKDVTLMIDAGAVVKLRRTNIDVGSSQQGIDRSGGALQVLGTPGESVYFTSYYDKTIGTDAYKGSLAASAGSWGGLVFHNSLDRQDGNGVLEDQGIFVNYVNHADIRYGGGTVNVGSVTQAYNSIYLDEARPTLTFNRITRGADYAISADPGSFEESRFEGNGESDLYTLDYGRVGPMLWGNTAVNNSGNGILVRVLDQSGQAPTELEVSARLRDCGMTYVIASNLLISGNPGGAVTTKGTTTLVPAGPRQVQTVDGDQILAGDTFSVSNGVNVAEFEFTTVSLLVGDGSAFTSGDTLTIYGYAIDGSIASRVLQFVDQAPLDQDWDADPYQISLLTDAGDPRSAIEIAYDIQSAFYSDSFVAGAILTAGTNSAAVLSLTGIAADPLYGKSGLTPGVLVQGTMNLPSGRIPIAFSEYDSAYRIAWNVGLTIESQNLFFNPTGGLFAPGSVSMGDDVVVIDGATVIFGGLSTVDARLHGRLMIDPGVVVKMDGARIETEIGAQFIAEGTPGNHVILTSLTDDRFGGGGTFDSSNNGASSGAAGDWSGLYFGLISTASIDNAEIYYGGGESPIEGGYAHFDVVEIQQAKVRIANTLFSDNEGTGSWGDQDYTRVGRGNATPATIFVRGAQPIILNNTFIDNGGATISIDCTAMKDVYVADWGRSTGFIDENGATSDFAQPYLGFEDYSGNFGPLVHGNRMTKSDINGMVVRGTELTAETVWDDTDIVHVLLDAITVPNFHTYGGIRLQSSATASLIVKLYGDTAGITATGSTQEIKDRIGGTVQIIGAPGYPVVMTSLADDSVGAGMDASGKPQFDTNNDGSKTRAHAGDWGGITFDGLCNDRNVATASELETSTARNDLAGNAQQLGTLATTLQGGDETLRLGLEALGVIDTPTDVDTYSFTGTAGTQVWISIDKTLLSLDTIVELVNADGVVLARSDNKIDEAYSPLSGALAVAGNLARPMSNSVWAVSDCYSINEKDAGMRLVLPGSAGQTRTYYVRVYSKDDPTTTAITTGIYHDERTTGGYRLQVRLQEADEVAGSVVHGANILYATNGIELLGLPTSSPILVESADVELNGGSNDSSGSAQDLGNLLGNNLGTLGVSGYIANSNDVDWYKFSVDLVGVQRIANVSGTGSLWPTIFDIDYADGMTRPNLTLWVFDDAGKLILTSTNSNIADDQANHDATDLSGGSFGALDPYIGPAFLPESGHTYYVAVTTTAVAASAFDQALLRREPIESVDRIVEDHINPITQTSNPTSQLASLDLTPTAYTLRDVVTYITTSSDLVTVNPVSGGQVTDTTNNVAPTDVLPNATTTSYNDIAMRNDGRLYALTTDVNSGASTYVELNTGDARTLVSAVGTGITTAVNTGTAVAATTAGVVFQALTHAYNAANGQRYVWAIGGVRGGPQNLLFVLNADGTAIQYPDVTFTATLDTTTTPATITALAPTDKHAAADAREFTNIVPYADLNKLLPTGVTANLTGLTIQGGKLYAVDDTGSLYSIDGIDPTANPAVAGNGANWGCVPVDSSEGGFGYNTWVANPASSILLTRIADTSVTGAAGFTGLTLGPQNVEGGKFKDMLFGTTAGNELVALDLTGVPQEVFTGGVSTIPLTNGTDPLANVAGVAFSTLDYNLWHQTTTRGMDEGHGIYTTYDYTRMAVDGSDYKRANPINTANGCISYYFGLENPTLPPISGPVASATDQPDAANYASNAGVYGTYNLPGGASGSLVTQTPFSLKGYSATDLPRLYFNYYLSTEGSSSYDGARVFITTDGGATWNIIATNTDWDSNSFKKEVGDNGGVQLVGNTGGWRQAVVDLAAYAGYDNIQLRFDFSTASDMDVGENETGGSYLQAIPGNQLDDGVVFTVDNNGTAELYEFDMGATITLPNAAGASIPDGERFTVTVGADSRTFEFDNNGVLFDTSATLIAIDASMSAEDVAEAISTALTNSGLAVTPTVSSERMAGPGTPGIAGMPAIPAFPLIYAGSDARPAVLGVTVGVMVAGATSITQTQAPASSFASGVAPFTSLTVQHDIGLPSINIPGTAKVTRIAFSPTDTAEDIAAKIAAAMDSTGISVTVEGTLVHIHGRSVTYSGVLAYGSELPGDAEAGDKVYPNINAERYTCYLRGANNAYEGFFIDDIIIGFAERGELITNATADVSFVANPGYKPINEVTRGAYTLEIREATPYGTWSWGAEKPYYAQVENSIDTNDRLNQSITLTVPDVTSLSHLSTFEISDGKNTVTFQFVGQYYNTTTNGWQDAAGYSSSSGYVPVRYHGTETPGQLAATIAAAVNRASTTLKLFNVSATTRDVNAAVMSNSAWNEAKVDLFNAANADGASIVATVYDELGDDNRLRDQGQVIVDSCQILYSEQYGIVVAPDTRDVNGNLPHPGAAAMLYATDSAGLVPGVSIVNNVIAFGGEGGIHISGDEDTFGVPDAAVPFVRVVNNTIYGLGKKVGNYGVRVETNAAATLLNNVVANFSWGISVDASCWNLLVVGNTAYQLNGLDSNLSSDGSFPLYLADNTTVFINPKPYNPADPTSRLPNFYPAYQSPIIDRSLNSLADRPALTAVRTPLGIPVSPIVVPGTDLNGQLRADDPSVTNAGGMGGNIFKDLGAIDRVDFDGPTATLLVPLDGSAKDYDPKPDAVTVIGQTPSTFTIQLIDTGSGIDDASVTTAAVRVYRDDVELKDGVDYTFAYNSATKIIDIVPAAGVWFGGHVYKVQLDNSLDVANRDTVAIVDLVGNPIHPNQLDQTTVFTIFIAQSPPKLLDVIDVTPDPRTSAVSTIDVTVQGLLVESTLVSSLGLTRNGVAVNLTAPNPLDPADVLKVIHVSGYTYRISGLERFTSAEGSYVLTVDGTVLRDVAGSVGVGTASDAWVKDATNPTLVDVVDVTPDPRNTPVPSIDVEFSEPVDLSTFTVANLSLTCNGAAVALGSSVVIAQVGSTATYRISGLTTPTSADGAYVLAVNAAGIQDLAGNIASGTASDAWTMDGTGPVIDIVDVTPDPRTTSVSSVVITFSEAIDKFAFTAGDLTLTRDGSPVTLDATVTVTWDSDTTCHVNGLGAFTSIGGTYVLTASGAGLVDTMGNVAANASDTWKLDTDMPAVASIVTMDANPTIDTFVRFALTFSEPVANVDAADLVIVAPGVTGAAITEVVAADATQTVYIVRVNTGTGDGLLRVDLVDNDTITDLIGHKLGGPGIGNGNYSAGESYSIIKNRHPNMVVECVGQTIVDGAAAASLADGTDFGATIIGHSPLTRTFTVRNTGGATLTTVTPVLPAGFTLVEPLDATILAGQSDTFTVQLNSANRGTFAGDLAIASNDEARPLFNFRISGTVTAASYSGIVVEGLGQPILDGDTTPSASDGTDFGSAVRNGEALTRTFTVRNPGTADLTLGTPSLPSGYTIIEPLAKTIVPGGSDSFTVQLSTATLGTFAGDITFATNDAANSPFNFRISGAVTTVAVSGTVVEGLGHTIADGDTTPSASDGTDFGWALVNTAALTRTFTVRNSRTVDLILGTPSVPNGYTIIEPLSGTIVPGGSDSFTVQLDTATVGTFAGDIAFATNDPSNTTYNFRVTGAVTSEKPTDLSYATVGLFNPASSVFSERNSNTAGGADTVFAYGPASAGWISIAGDWNGDGVDTVGLYDPAASTFYLKNSNTGGYADVTFAYGPGGANWKPIAGDWNGDGVDTVGLYDPSASVFYLRNTNTSGYADVTYAYGPGGSGWTPISGDWNGDNQDTVGLYDPAASTFYLRNTNTSGFADATFAYGPGNNAGWKPFAGDWDGDGLDTIALYDPAGSGFYLRNSNSRGFADTAFVFGAAGGGYTPVAGDWDGTSSALRADVASIAAKGVSTLTDADLEPLVAEAVNRWASAGLDASLLAKLKQVDVAVTDLPGSVLGEANGNRVSIDSDAAGHGWFIDATPSSDEEYSLSATGGRLGAISAAAVDRIDLLTVVEHELGHIAGLDDLDMLADDLMSNTLQTGVRREAVVRPTGRK